MYFVTAYYHNAEAQLRAQVFKELEYMLSVCYNNITTIVFLLDKSIRNHILNMQ